MKTLAAIVLMTSLAVGEDVVAPRQAPRKSAPPRIGRPIRVPVQATFAMKIETKPRFPKAARPAASQVAETKGLAVTIQPEKNTFAGNGPLAFEVVFENKSKKPILLHGLEHLGVGPKLVAANLANTNQWTVVGKFEKAKNMPAVKLAVGEKKKYTLVVEATRFIRPPVIVPFPRPRPRLFPARGDVKVDRAVAAPPRRGKPIQIAPPRRRPPVFIGSLLPCGQGKCRVRLLLEFKQAANAGKQAASQWVGRVATGTVDFTVGKPVPGVVPPIVVQPFTKERAITSAHAAAERALKANYKPVAGIRPAHKGAWITDPQKSAGVKVKKGTGWTIQWTSFPKAGFSYNVTVDVNTGGGAVVREIFTGFSGK